MSINVGDSAPGFQLRDETGTIRTLEEFRDKKIVLYFYPKDNTPGCTKEACSFRDGYRILQNEGIIIIGVNYDSVESHKKFKEKHHLPFILLTDEKKEVAKAYGATGGLFSSFVPKRKTFLINEERKIVYIFNKVDVGNHAKEVLKMFSVHSSLK